MKRIYDLVFEDHFKNNNQIAFIVGPRQVGKTTTSCSLKKEIYYLNWDNLDDRELILKGPKAISESVNLALLRAHPPMLVFDEIHKYSKWQVFLKGFYDTYKDKCNIAVTGSSSMDTYRRGGDSLMGRYFTYRMHPITLRETKTSKLYPEDSDRELFLPIKTDTLTLSNLLEFGGFPEPYIKGTRAFYNKWIRLRLDQLFKDDIRDLSRVQEIDQLYILGRLLARQSGQLMSYTSL
ncbi:MAG: ATP-binding protein, partial [Nitrospira sp.]|nr:ATP-binding protein [Nitrospira sp.]